MNVKMSFIRFSETKSTALWHMKARNVCGRSEKEQKAKNRPIDLLSNFVITEITLKNKNLSTPLLVIRFPFRFEFLLCLELSNLFLTQPLLFTPCRKIRVDKRQKNGYNKGRTSRHACDREHFLFEGGYYVVQNFGTGSISEGL